MAEERLSAFRWRIKLVPILTASSTDTQPKHHPTPIRPVCISRIHLLPSSRAGSPSLDPTGPHPPGPDRCPFKPRGGCSCLCCSSVRSLTGHVFVCQQGVFLQHQGLLFLGFRFISIVRSLLFGRTERKIQIGLRLNGRTNKRLTIFALFTRLPHTTSSI